MRREPCFWWDLVVSHHAPFIPPSLSSRIGLYISVETLIVLGVEHSWCVDVWVLAEQSAAGFQTMAHFVIAWEGVVCIRGDSMFIFFATERRSSLSVLGGARVLFRRNNQSVREPSSSAIQVRPSGMVVLGR